MSRPRIVIGALMVVLVSSVCVRLGIWQLDRLAARRAVHAEREARRAQPVVVLRAVDQELEPYRRVEVEGRFDYAHQIIVVGHSWQGAPGVFVVTPLRLEEGGAVLVQRGWLYSPDARTVDLSPFSPAGSRTVHAVALPKEPGPADDPAPRWPLAVRRLSVPNVADRFPYRLHPTVLWQLPAPSLPALPRPIDLPAPGNGPHLFYAVQWFSFALIFPLGLVALLRSQKRRPPPSRFSLQRTPDRRQNRT